MSHAVLESLDCGEPVATFPTDLPTLRELSVEWIGAASQRLASRTDLIKKVCISLSASITADTICKAWSTISAGDWNLSYEFLTSTWMKDII